MLKRNLTFGLLVAFSCLLIGCDNGEEMKKKSAVLPVKKTVIAQPAILFTMNPVEAYMEPGGIAVNEDVGKITISINLTQAVSEDVTFYVSTICGLAGVMPGADYGPLVNEPVTIPAGQTSATFDVIIHDDLHQEWTEDFRVQIVSVSTNANVLVVMDMVGVTIYDND